MMPGGCSDHGGIDAVQQRVVAGMGLHPQFLRQASRGLLQRIGDCDELERGQPAGESSVDAAQMSGADDGEANFRSHIYGGRRDNGRPLQFRQAARRRSRERPCLPSCWFWIKVSS